MNNSEDSECPNILEAAAPAVVTEGSIFVGTTVDNTGNYMTISSDQTHPLTMPHVCEAIFQYLPVPDLKSCRTVCKAWSDEACKKMLKHTKISLEFYGSTMYLPISPSTLGFTFRGFEEGKYFLDKYAHLFRKVAIQVSTYKIMQLYYILQSISKVESLGLCLPIGSSFRIIGSFHSFFNALNVSNEDVNISLPTVTHLYLGINCDSQSFDALERDKFLEYILSIVPNVQVISVMGNCRGNIRRSCNHNSVVFKRVTSGYVKLDHLEQLNFNLKLNTVESFQLLMEKQFSLTHLDITVCSGPAVTADHVHSLLTRFSKLLRSLTIRGATHVRAPGLPMAGQIRQDPLIPSVDALLPFELCAKLEQLEELTLVWLKGSVDMIHAVQGLKYLHLENFDYDSIIVPITLVQTHRLETLIIDGNQLLRPTCSKRVMQHLLSQFPFLKRLKIGNLRNLPLGYIFTTNPLLEELSVASNRVKDPDITGISHVKVSSHSRVPADKPPSINSLKYLRKIRIRSSELTASSILYGLLKCPDLEKVSLTSEKICVEMMLKLVHQLPIQMLSFYTHMESNKLKSIEQLRGLKQVKINGIKFEPVEWRSDYRRILKTVTTRTEKFSLKCSGFNFRTYQVEREPSFRPLESELAAGVRAEIISPFL